MAAASYSICRVNPFPFSFPLPHTLWRPTCYDYRVPNRTEPRTLGQWIRYLVVAIIALFLVWWLLRVYVL